MEVPVYRNGETPIRAYTIQRKTKETDIQLSLALEGGEVAVKTGIGFFDHMLTAFAFYGGLGLKLEVQGIWRWTATTPWRTWVSSWARP